MTLVDLSNLQWRAGRMKRNLALFTHLLRGAALDRGIYVNLSWTPARQSLTDYFAVPIVETLTTYTVGDAPVIVLRPKNALPLSYRTETFSRLSGALFARKIWGLMAGDRYILWLNTIDSIECDMAAALARRAAMVVLDNSDDLPALGPPELRQAAEHRLQRMLRLADKTLCVNEHVFSKIQHPCRQ